MCPTFVEVGRVGRFIFLEHWINFSAKPTQKQISREVVHAGLGFKFGQFSHPSGS